jgi:hypothetical protein
MGVVVVAMMMMKTMIVTMTCQKHRCVSVSCIFKDSRVTASNIPHERYEFVRAVLLTIQIFWDVMSC